MERGNTRRCFIMMRLLVAIIITLNCSAYSHSGNPTASGVMPREGMCAADYINGKLVPFGTKITLPDGRTLVVTDRFGGNYTDRLDIFLNSEADCWKWGRRWLECRIEMP